MNNRINEVVFLKITSGSFFYLFLSYYGNLYEGIYMKNGRNRWNCKLNACFCENLYWRNKWWKQKPVLKITFHFSINGRFSGVCQCWRSTLQEGSECWWVNYSPGSAQHTVWSIGLCQSFCKQRQKALWAWRAPSEVCVWTVICVRSFESVAAAHLRCGLAVPFSFSW